MDWIKDNLQLLTIAFLVVVGGVELRTAVWAQDERIETNAGKVQDVDAQVRRIGSSVAALTEKVDASIKAQDQTASDVREIQSDIKAILGLIRDRD